MRKSSILLSFCSLFLSGCLSPPLDGAGEVVIVCPKQFAVGHSWELEVCDANDGHLLYSASGNPETVPTLYLSDIPMVFRPRNDTASVYLGGVDLKIKVGSVSYRLMSTGAACSRWAVGNKDVYLCVLPPDKFRTELSPADSQHMEMDMNPHDTVEQGVEEFEEMGTSANSPVD